METMGEEEVGSTSHHQCSGGVVVVLATMEGDDIATVGEGLKTALLAGAAGGLLGVHLMIGNG